MEREREVGMAMGSEEEEEGEVKMEMEMELSAAHALANLAGSDHHPNQSSDSQEEGPYQLQALSGETSIELKGNKFPNQTADKKGSANSVNPQEVSSMRGQKCLNEAEREAKRLRRILANRESARQTILRRQAIREELARKVAALSSENQHMKAEKETAMEEYLSLKEANMKLKEQLAWLSMSQSMPHYMWGHAWFPRVQDFVKCDSNAPVGSSGPCFDFSSRYSLLINPELHWGTPASNDSERCEQRQFVPNALESEVSCSLTLGLETKTKPKSQHADTSRGKIILACSKETSDVAKVPPAVKATAKARRKRREIIKLKQMHNNKYF